MSKLKKEPKISYKIVKKLDDKGYPSSDKHYESAHEEANKAEKKKFPKGYQILKRDIRHLKKYEAMGTNKKSGKIEIESKFKKYAKEIAYHEKMEHQNLKSMNKRKG